MFPRQLTSLLTLSRSPRFSGLQLLLNTIFGLVPAKVLSSSMSSTFKAITGQIPRCYFDRKGHTTEVDSPLSSASRIFWYTPPFLSEFIFLHHHVPTVVQSFPHKSDLNTPEFHMHEPLLPHEYFLVTCLTYNNCVHVGLHRPSEHLRNKCGKCQSIGNL